MKRKTTRYFNTCAAGLLLFMLCSFSAHAHTSGLKGAIDAVLSDGRLDGADTAVLVAGLDCGGTLFSKNAAGGFIPASNQKILTAAAALDVLGKDYEFVTTLWMDGAVKRGVLDGNLIIVGGGDPTFGSPSAGEYPTAQFDRWARLIRGFGVLKVSGDLIIDESFFDSGYVHPDWPENQLSRPYSAPVSGFIFHDNCLRLTVRPSAEVGARAAVDVYPPLGLFRIENSCRTGTGSNIILAERTNRTIRVGGEARHRHGGWSGLISVPDPAVFAGETFAYVLRSHGIELGGGVRTKSLQGSAPGATDSEGRYLIARRRASLEMVLRTMLFDSRNLYAESVLKTLGAERKGAGSWQSGTAVVAQALEKRGADRADFRVADGSGYSRNNSVSARMLCDLLIQMHGEADGALLKKLLPQGGADGTLARRFSGSAHAGRVRAKSGYLAGVGALSGYVCADSGRSFAFVIMINNFTRGSNWDMRQIQDSIVKAIIENG